jgi:hypothetical protein
MEPRTQHRIRRPGQKKNPTPLSKLRTAEAVKTVVAHPRRFNELLSLLEDSDRAIRGKAAAALVSLSLSHPGRLAGSLSRLEGALNDDSAYVRWHVVTAIGALAVHYPRRAVELVRQLAGVLQDDNRVVRLMTGRALVRVSLVEPEVVAEAFSTVKGEVPQEVAQILSECARERQQRPAKGGGRS